MKRTAPLLLLCVIPSSTTRYLLHFLRIAKSPNCEVLTASGGQECTAVKAIGTSCFNFTGAKTDGIKKHIGHTLFRVHQSEKPENANCLYLKSVNDTPKVCDLRISL